MTFLLISPILMHGFLASRHTKSNKSRPDPFITFQLRRPLILVLDRWSVHRAAVRELANKRPAWLVAVSWLPPYAPELNPVEQVWNHTKYSELANYLPTNLEALCDEVGVSLASRRASAAGARPGRCDAGRNPRRTARAAGEESPGQCQPQPPLSGAASAGAVAKKKSPRASQADPQERAACQETQQRLARADLSFLDEFGRHLARTRPHARALIGERANVTAPFHHGSNLSVISALGVHGVCTPMTIAGAVNSEVFARYVEPRLVPCLRPGNRVVLDHGKCHYTPRAIELREAAGAGVGHIPAYSPDLNPLEEGIAKLKETLRSFKARTQRKLSTALAKALALVTEGDICGWFEHCAYVFSLK